MKFLLDTNILIPAEPTSPDEIEQGHPLTLELLRSLAGGHHQIYVHPASLDDLSHDRNVVRRQTTRSLDEAMELAQLIQHSVIQIAPHSITRVREEGTSWIRDQLGLSL